MSEEVPADGGKRYGPLRRVVLVVVGGAMTLTGVAVSIVLTVVFRRAVADGKLSGAKVLQGGLVFAFAVLLFGAFAVIGGLRAMSGVRGRPRTRVAAAVRAEGWYRRNWYVVGLVVWGIASGMILFMAGDPGALLTSRAFSAGRVTWLVFLAFVVLPIHVAVHELSHAVAGAFLNFRFVETRVGWFALHRGGGRLRIRWSPPTIQGVLGFHSAIPDGETGVRKRWALMAAAGPTASLVAALACRAALVGPDRNTVGLAVVSDLLSVGWWVGAAVAVMTAIPVRLPAGILSDGAVVAHAFLPFVARWKKSRSQR